MTWNRWISVLGLFLWAATWVGCETDPPVSLVHCADDEIRVGNSLIISVLDVPESLVDKEFTVRADGTVNLPHLGPVVATNKAFGAFERELQRAYVDKGIFPKPTVVVKAGLRFFTVAGEVKGAGAQAYVGPTTILRAIAACGDFTEFANRRKVQVTRVNGKTEFVDCKKARIHPEKFDSVICPGDYIFVPKSL